MDRTCSKISLRFAVILAIPLDSLTFFIIPKATASNGSGRSANSMSRVSYKCLRCGHLDEFEGIRTGIACKACGFRIFVKPRRQGHKTLDAI